MRAFVLFFLGNDRITNYHHLIFLITIVTTTRSVLHDEILALYDLHGIVKLQYVYTRTVHSSPSITTQCCCMGA